MAYFYIDDGTDHGHRYDFGRFMEFSEDIYDDFTSYLLKELKTLPAAGVYSIKTREFRPRRVFPRYIRGHLLLAGAHGIQRCPRASRI